MTRFSVKLSNILGLSFYRYELTSSTYNPTIDTNFTITCKVTDVFGNNISGKTITLYHDGSSVSNQTTDSTGVATWTINPSTWGVHDFNVSNKHIQVDVKGFKQITLTNLSGCTLWHNEDFCALKINKSITISSANSWLDVGSGTIPSSYRPSVNVTELNDGTINCKYRVGTDGKVQVTSDYKPSSSFTGQAMIIWAKT